MPVYEMLNRKVKLITMEFVDNFQWRIVASYEMMMAKPVVRYLRKYVTYFVMLGTAYEVLVLLMKVC